MKSLYVAGAATLLFVSCGRQQNSTNNTQLPKYPAMVVTAGTAELTTNYPVTLRGREDIEIRPRIDGFIEQIYIDEGSAVKQGQVLFKINSPQAEQAVTTAMAAVTAADAQLATATLNVERMKPLAEQGIISNVQLQSYQNAESAAKAAHAQAKAQLTNAEATLSWASVKSPVDGYVGAVAYRKGSLVNNQNVLTTVANTTSVFAFFSLNEKALTQFLGGLEGKNQIEKLKHAPEITLTLADGTVYPYKGKIETIAGVVNTATGSANFRAEFPNEERLLRSGASGTISIPRYMDKVVVIPQKATFARQDKIIAYKVQGDSVVQKVITVLPTPDARSYVVIDGIGEGDRIVTDGLASLSHGKKVEIETL
ncbi:MAG: efflux RND transporter periplasmic adaptor subunit [Bacteroidales bacterium]|nr:efflux RND transporter periplasmic adaptor subunit [Bacteroidales bacterium]